MAGLNERVAAFLTAGDGIGFGYGSGDGIGFGCSRGCGRGNGYGSGDGIGRGSGYGSGFGFGRGFASGSGIGRGSGYGSGDGIGYGSGYGSGDGIGYGSGSEDVKSFCGAEVHEIDGVCTIIDRIYGGVAKGRILNSDLTTTPCYVVKGDGHFAHGDTLHRAMEALRDKQFDDMPQEDRIAAFIREHEPGKSYPCRDLYDWHHRLTGSCEMGRQTFAKDHGIDVEHDSMTVEQFIELTRSAYGGEVIRALEAKLQIEAEEASQNA